MFIKLILRLFLFIIFFVLNTNYILANTVIFSDDFNDNSIDDWTTVRNSQTSNNNFPCMNNTNPASWSVSDGKVRIDIINSPHCITEIVPNNLNLTSINNYEYSFDIKMVDTVYTDRNAIFLWKDKDNWYDVKTYGQSILVQKVVNGRVRTLPNPQRTYPFVNNIVYRVKITYINNVIALYINGIKINEILDGDPFITGFKTLGLQASVGSVGTSKVEFDNILVRTIDNAQTLPVPSYKQTDPQWANQEYDSASSWSPATPFMSDWGCAVTSVVMIMNFHGINKLPDGSNLTPETLNNWLKSQADGYVHGGLVNWLAISRLTKQIANQYSTPKLEYSRSNGADKTKAFQEIEANKPVMLEIAGHFLVGKGKQNEDLVINDPYYNYNLFAEHNKPLLSTRTFQPSNTDLSGIILATTGTQTTNLLFNDTPVADASYTQEFIQSPVTGTNSPTVSIVEYMKPSQGMYSVALNTDTPYSPFTMNLHIYNVDGSVKSKSLNGISDNNGHATLRFNFDGTSEVIIRKDSSFSQLIAALHTLFQASHLQKKYLVFGLNSYIEFAQLASPEIQLRYIQFLTEIITKQQQHFSAEGKTYLLQELNEIKHTIEQSS